MHEKLLSVDRSATRRDSAALPQLHRLHGWILGLVAREDVDMVVMQSSGSDHESVRVESCRGDWSRSIAQEARVGFKVRNELSVVDVEDLYAMLLSSTATLLANRPNAFRSDLRSKDRRVLVNAESAQMVCCRLDGLHTAIHPDVPQLHFSTPAAAH
jgi:hypothetical protein